MEVAQGHSDLKSLITFGNSKMVELQKSIPFLALSLKYGFSKKSLRKNETLTSWTLLAHFFSRSGWSGKKWGKSVQLVRVSFFLSDFLQNPYFKPWRRGIRITFGDHVVIHGNPIIPTTRGFATRGSVMFRPILLKELMQCQKLGMILEKASH